MKCLDTYSLVEIHNGNPSFSRLLDEEIVITDITMSEFYGQLYRKLGRETAEYWFKKFRPCCRQVPLTLLVKAVQYRLDHASERLSYFDCVGYLFSLENHVPFVTGDTAFEHRPGVEFVKGSAGGTKAGGNEGSSNDDTKRDAGLKALEDAKRISKHITGRRSEDIIREWRDKRK